MVDLLPRWIESYEAKDFKGKLSRSFSLTDVHVHQSDIQLKATTITVDWHIESLLGALKKNIILDKVYVHNFSLSLPQSTDHNEVDLDTLDLENFEIPPPSSKINIQLPISIKTLVLEKGKIRSPQFKLNFKLLQANEVDFKTLTFQGLSLDATAVKINVEPLPTALHITWDIKIKSLKRYFTAVEGDLNTQGQTYLNTQNLTHTQTQFSLQSKILKTQKHLLQNLKAQVYPQKTHHILTLEGRADTHSFKGNIETQFYKKKIVATLSGFASANGTLTVSISKKVKADLTLQILGKNKATAHLLLQPKAPYPIEGVIDAAFNDFAILNQNIPELSGLKGAWESHLQITGTLLGPKLQGEALAKNITFRVPHSGAKANLERFEIKGIGSEQMTLSGNGTVGEGTFTLTGFGDIKQGKPSLNVIFEGKHLVVSNTPEYYIVTNPKLQLTLQDGQTILTGDVLIPEANINPNIRNGHIARSEDIIIVSNQPEVDTPKFNDSIQSEIKFRLGDNVTFNGFGVKTKVKGELIISKRPARAARATGTLYSKNGKYKNHNRSLDITYGQIIFSGGPITQPLLDIRAQKEIKNNTKEHNRFNEIVVGMHLKGPLHALKLVPFSQPALPESEVLSYLALGHASGQGITLPGNVLLDSASTLSNLLGNSTSDGPDLLSKLNLDVGIQSATQATSGQSPFEESAVTIGKQLSSKLYMNYSVGILDSASQVGLRYLLGKNMSLEAQTGAKGSGADFLITLEGR